MTEHICIHAFALMSYIKKLDFPHGLPLHHHVSTMPERLFPTLFQGCAPYWRRVFKITKELLSNDPADQPCPWSKGSIKAVCLALIFCSSLPYTPVLSEDVVQPRPVSPSPGPTAEGDPQSSGCTSFLLACIVSHISRIIQTWFTFNTTEE